MPGYILLAGGAEFEGEMAAADLRAIELAGGPHAPVRIIPAAAAPDDNHRRAGANGVRWFRALGAQDVASLNLIDTETAADPALVAELRAARLIYMLGGFPGYLARTLLNSPAWEAMLAAYDAGAVLGGSSAGAMALAEHLYDPYEDQLQPGLSLLAGVCILPHFNRFGHAWVANLKTRLPGVRLLGIEEGTAWINDGPDGAWRVYGDH